MDPLKDHPDHAFKDQSHEVPSPSKIKKEVAKSIESKLTIAENKIAAAASLLLFSFIGVLVRIYSEQVLTYMGEPVAAIIYPQIIGCFIIGIVIELKAKIESSSHTLFIGITTGLCGSITTFSGVILGSSQQYFNVLGYERTMAQNIMAGLTVDLLGFGMGFIAFLFGKHIGEWLNEEYIKTLPLCTGNLVYANPTWFKEEHITKTDVMIIILGVLSALGVTTASLTFNMDRRLVYALIFAPVGTFMRRWMSALNRINQKFPLGTLLVNIIGSAVLVLLFLIPGVTAVSNTHCYILAGLMTGFCGCFTTVSTWVVELSFLNKKYAYIYGAASIIFAEILSITLFLAMKTHQPYYNNLCTI